MPKLKISDRTYILTSATRDSAVVFRTRGPRSGASFACASHSQTARIRNVQDHGFERIRLHALLIGGCGGGDIEDFARFLFTLLREDRNSD
jgi:hypothetical protein